MSSFSGKSVDQYHEEKNGKKTLINLGRFDQAKHLEWIEKNPSKRPKPRDQRKHVSHFYSGGDLCDLTGQYSFCGALRVLVKGKGQKEKADTIF
jgi:hypothetical protein